MAAVILNFRIRSRSGDGCSILGKVVLRSVVVLAMSGSDSCVEQ